MLTETQKNVAVRLLVGQKVKDIAEEFGITVHHVGDMMKLQEFLDYKDHLADTNRERVMQFLESKQMRCLRRLEELMGNDLDLKVARQAAVDLLGYSGLESKNIPAPPIITQNNYADTSESELDDELEEVDGLLNDDEKEDKPKKKR